MSEIIKKIESIIGKELTKAPVRRYDDEDDHLSAVMPYKRKTAKYAVQVDKVIGLNLADTGLTDTQWREIAAIDGLASNLQALNLSDNALTVFSGGGVSYPQLRRLNLADNQIRRFALAGKYPQLEEVDLEDNPVEEPPQEVLVQGRVAVLRYLKELQTFGKKEVYEVKLMIVGEGETGKTTLWNLLKNPNHPVPDVNQKSTVGIKLRKDGIFPIWIILQIPLSHIFGILGVRKSNI